MYTCNTYTHKHAHICTHIPGEKDIWKIDGLDLFEKTDLWLRKFPVYCADGPAPTRIDGMYACIHFVYPVHAYICICMHVYCADGPAPTRIDGMYVYIYFLSLQ